MLSYQNFLYQPKNYAFFHFSKAIWTNIQKLGFSIIYLKKKEFNKCIRKILCLALVPINNVIIEYQLIKEEIIRLNLKDFTPLFNYIEKQYFGILC